MSNILKSTKLDIALVKPYFKTICFTHVLAVVLSQPGGTPPEVSCKGAKPLAFVGGNALLVD